MLANYPHHVVQREHNRQVVFAERRDFERYLESLAEFKTVFDVKVYAYCLMTNHVHLLLAPDALSQSLRGADGHLLGEPLKLSPIDSDSYLLACVRYIELNPVRARMTSTPEAYRWSSCG
jgi:putative transposase